MRPLEDNAWPKTALLLLVFLQLATAEDYKFVNLFESVVTSRSDDTGTTTDMGSLAAGTVHEFSSPTVVIGESSSPSFLMEWSNYAAAGREFANKPTASGSATYGFFATESSATVTVQVDGAVVETHTIPALTSWTLSGSFSGQLVEINSTADVLVAQHSDGQAFLPLLPVAQTVFGQCSGYCELVVTGGTDDPPVSPTIAERCTDGNVSFASAGRITTDVLNWNGKTCFWTVSAGYKLSGTTGGDGAGDEGVALVPADLFQHVTPLPTIMQYVLLISQFPAQCTYGGSSVTLTGAHAIYHARLVSQSAATVFECDQPVTAIGDAACPADFGTPCTHKEMNLIAAPLPMTATTTSTTSSTGSATTTCTEKATDTSTSSATTTWTAATMTSTATITSSSASSTTTAMTTASSTSTTSVTTTPTLTTATTTSTSSATGMTSSTITSSSRAETTLTASTTATSTGSTTTVTLTASTTTSSSSTETTLTTSTTATSTGSATAATLTASTSTSSGTSTVTVTSTTVSTTGTTVTATTTATASEPEATMAAATLVDRVESLEASLLPAFLEGNTSTALRVGGLTLVAVKLDEAMVEAAGGSLTVVVEGTGVAVTVAASLFASPGINAEGVVLIVVAVDPTSEDFPSAAGELEMQVAAVVNVNLYSLAGHRLSVTGLVDPIKVVMPVNESAGLQCAFWDEAELGWGSRGVELGRLEESAVECMCSHLTLFAAIFRGFVNTFACSHVVLLNAESLRELGRGDWHRAPGAMVLWCMASAFVLLLCLAAWLDWNRRRQGRSNDEHFLISMEGKRQAVRLEEVEEVAEVVLEEAKPSKKSGNDGGSGKGSGLQRRLRACARASAAVCTAGGDWCRSSGVLRDALDEVFSQWAEYFGEIRDFVEGLTQGLDLCHSGAQRSNRALLVHRLMCMTLVLSARRQAAASLGISCDVSSLVMEDEDMFDVLLAHRTRKPPEEAGAEDTPLEEAAAQGAAAQGTAADCSPAEGSAAGSLDSLPKSVSRKTLAREQAWGQLHREVEAKLDAYMEASAHWSSLPGTVWRLFLYQNPFSACLVHCAFTSCKQRVLLFMVDVAGALMLATVFFAASGVPRKRGRALDCRFDDPFEFSGRVLAIGTGSLFTASIPALVLGSLCTRGFRKFDYEGCPAWNRQLEVWRTQDKAIWLLGLLYLAFCLLFACLFLANVDQRDHKNWLLSGFVSVAESIFVIPLAVAVALPLLTAACLHFVSHHRKATKEQLISERHLEFKREGNMTLPMERI